MAPLIVTWPHLGSFRRFIAELAEKAQKVILGSGKDSIELVVSEVFLRAYARLDDENVSDVLGALQKTPVRSISMLVRHEPSERLQKRFGILYETLGGMPHLKVVHLTIKDLKSGASAARAFSCPMNVIFALNSTPDEPLQGVNDLSRALEACCVRQVSFCLETLNHYSAMASLAPVLPAFASQGKVVIASEDGDGIPLDGGVAIAQVLQQPLIVELDGFDLRFTQLIFDALKASMATKLHLNLLTIDGASLADALSTCKILAVSVSQWTEESASTLPAFFRTLAAGMPNISISELDFSKLLDGWEVAEGEVEAVERELSAVIRAAASNPAIKVLGLSLCQPPSVEIDRALAHLAQSSICQLEELTLSCPRKETQANKASAPRFLESLKSNLSTTLRNVRFSLNDGPAMDIPDHENPWDTNLLTDISIILRLNQCGRIYMKHELMNQQKSFQVLETIKDDPTLDGLYFHLRENPFVCQRRVTGEQDHDCGCRKRSNTGGQSPSSRRRID